MAWNFFGNGLYVYNSNTDTQVTVGITEGSGLIDLYTSARYYFTAGAWTLLAGAGGGEANTASNFGTVGVGLWKDKNIHDLRFYKINPLDTKVSIALNGTDRVDIGVNQANLAIAWSQLTGVPVTFPPSAHTHAAADINSGTFAWTMVSKTGSALGDIANINLTGLLDGQSIKWDSASAKWIVYTPGTGGSGEVNTASNFGTVGVGLWKDKNVADLRFYKINPVDNKVTIALNGTDRVDIGVDQANLAIAWSQLTGVPATFPPSGHNDSHNSAGTDSFAKTDILSAQTRYLENRADPTSDSGAIWINPTSEVIRYWDTLATPVLRTLVNLASIQTLTNKTLNVDSNTIKHSTTNTSGDLLVNNGTKFDRLARGTAMQVYRINSAGTGGEFASLDSERTGKGVANGGVTAYTIAHGLGVVPAYVFVDCASHAIGRTYTVDATNITVTFASATPSGTNNVIIYWRVIAA